MITLQGEGFASRVVASLYASAPATVGNHECGAGGVCDSGSLLSHLVTSSQKEFEEAAVRLVRLRPRGRTRRKVGPASSNSGGAVGGAYVGVTHRAVLVGLQASVRQLTISGNRSSHSSGGDSNRNDPANSANSSSDAVPSSAAASSARSASVGLFDGASNVRKFLVGVQAMYELAFLRWMWGGDRGNKGGRTGIHSSRDTAGKMPHLIVHATDKHKYQLYR